MDWMDQGRFKEQTKVSVNKILCIFSFSYQGQRTDQIRQILGIGNDHGRYVLHIVSVSYDWKQLCVEYLALLFLLLLDTRHCTEYLYTLRTEESHCFFYFYISITQERRAGIHSVWVDQQASHSSEKNKTWLSSWGIHGLGRLLRGSERPRVIDKRHRFDVFKQ